MSDIVSVTQDDPPDCHPARAERDAEHIYGWILARSPQGALAWWRSFEQAIRRIAGQVDVAGQAPENDLFPEYIQQKIFHTNRGRRYRIVFTVSVDDILVLRVRGPGKPPLTADEMAAHE